jgi:hypothetical protein
MSTRNELIKAAVRTIDLERQNMIRLLELEIKVIDAIQAKTGEYLDEQEDFKQERRCEIGRIVGIYTQLKLEIERLSD